MSLSTLSLDAAIQLDHIERHQSYERGILDDFLRRLATFDGGESADGEFCLSGDPVNVEIFNNALHVETGLPIKNVAELDQKLKDFYNTMQKVANGDSFEQVPMLKAVCLSLHRVLLRQNSPYVEEDDWILTNHEQLA